MATSDSTDPHTLSYLSLLPLALATLPPFSCAANHTLRPLQQPPRISTTQLECAACQAELVAGLSGSYWIDKGELWANCYWCGWTSRRPAEAKVDGGVWTRRSQFERVKKRRRVEVKRATEVAHPTLLAAEQGTAAKDGLVSGLYTSKQLLGFRSASVEKVDAPSKASTSSTTVFDDIRPPISLQSSTRQPSEVPPSRTSSVKPSLASSARPSLIPTSAHPSPPPSSRFSTLSAASTPPSDSPADPAPRKRKRPKQPTGLAEMLEAKKRKEKEAAGGAGLADFLQGL